MAIKAYIQESGNPTFPFCKRSEMSTEETAQYWEVCPVKMSAVCENMSGLGQN